MARPREFDEDEALDQATRVFWAHGFRATTPDALLQAMGIGKGSFYAVFGSKRELFLRCLRHYGDGLARALESSLAHEDIRHGLAAVRELVIHSACESRAGCLMWNTASELSPHDEEVASIVQAAMARNEAIYAKRLRQAQRAGQIAAGKDVRTLAAYFVACFAGLQLVGKGNPDAARLRAVADFALKSLD